MKTKTTKKTHGYREITFNGEELLVDMTTGEIKYKDTTAHRSERPYTERRQNRRTGYTNPYYMTAVYNPRTKKSRHINTARLVCEAAHGKPKSPDMQVDHIDSNPTNNRPSNLRWVSRKQNNSRPHKRKMLRKNSRTTTHKDQILLGWNTTTLQTRYFINGMHAAKSIGCSHVLVYNAIAGKVCDHACGWKLKWVDRKDVSFIAVEGAAADWLKMQGKTTKAVRRQITEKVTAMIREVKVKKWKEILAMENLTVAEKRELKKKTTAKLNADKEMFIKNEIDLALDLNNNEETEEN